MLLVWAINNLKMGALLRWVQKTMMNKEYRCADEEKCLELIRVMLDDDATKEDASYVMEHIDGCFRCYGIYDLENAIREAVRTKSNNLKVSEDLKAEIVAKLNL
jgi:anti-sigma factor (TIGR02949 family)